MADYRCDKLIDAAGDVRVDQGIYGYPSTGGVGERRSGFVSDLPSATERGLTRRKQERVKAIRVKEFGEPEVLRLEEVPMPKLGPDEVVVLVHATGVNPVETYIRAGKYARLPELP